MQLLFMFAVIIISLAEYYGTDCSNNHSSKFGSSGNLGTINIHVEIVCPLLTAPLSCADVGGGGDPLGISLAVCARFGSHAPRFSSHEQGQAQTEQIEVGKKVNTQTNHAS